METKSRIISLWGYDAKQAEKENNQRKRSITYDRLLPRLAYTSQADAQVQEKGKTIFMKLNFRWFGDKTFAPNKA